MRLQVFTSLAGDPDDAVYPTLTAAVEAAARPIPDRRGAGDHGG